MKNKIYQIYQNICFLILVLIVLLFETTFSFCQEEDKENSKAIIHLVKEGDTLAKIAYKYYSDGKKYPIIAKANRIKNPHKIRIGNVLIIPNLPLELPETISVTGSSMSLTQFQPIEVSSGPFVWRKETNNAFPANEKLLFEVSWKFLTIGYATLEVRGIENVGDRPAYHIVNETRSTPFFDKIYKVRNMYESWIDTESLCSLKYSENAYEKDEIKTKTVLYDQINLKYSVVGKEESGDIFPWIHDAFSSLYYIRTKELEVGKDYSIDVNSGDKSYPLIVKVLGREKKKVPAGEFECFILEPHVKEGTGIFKSSGRLWIWVTADQRKAPVMMRSQISIGSITARLKSME
ncbi:MAG: DUF3108 domain-containing protein [Elusimicrobia bacterium]|nr:DUF3108 domain-containing protein [Elusimicrobiota bacterium]